MSPVCPLRRWPINWGSLKVTLTCQYFVFFSFLEGTSFSKKWGCHCPVVRWLEWCLYTLHLLGETESWGHLLALCQCGSWMREFGARGAFARTLLTNWPQPLCPMSQLTDICHRLYICVSDPSLFYPSWSQIFVMLLGFGVGWGVKVLWAGKRQAQPIDCRILRWQKWREGLVVPCDGKCCEHVEGPARPRSLKSLCIFRETKPDTR